MWLNYSYLKILKLKIYSSFLFLVRFFCAHVTWQQDLATLTVLVFSLPFFLKANPKFLLLVSLKSPLNWSKIQKGLLLQNNKIVKPGNLVTGIKIFTSNNWIISIVPILANSKFAIIPSCFDKWHKFYYSLS